MALNAGFAFGPATAGLLAKKSFTWLFIGDAATSILFGLVAWFFLPAGVRGTRAGGTLREIASILSKDKKFVQVLCAVLATALVFVQAFSTMSLEVTRHGFSPAVYGLIISLNGALVVFFELPMTTITKRFPARRMMALGFLLIGAGFASNGLTRTLPLLVCTSVDAGLQRLCRRSGPAASARLLYGNVWPRLVRCVRVRAQSRFASLFCELPGAVDGLWCPWHSVGGDYSR